MLKDNCKGINRKGYYKLKVYWTLIETDKMKKFTGTLLLIGIYETKWEYVSQLWSKSDGRPIFNKFLSLNRFKEILRMRLFDQTVARRHSRSPDKVRPIRKILELWNNTVHDAYFPGANDSRRAR